MGGGWQTYRCDRCPLVIELGGSVFWNEAAVVCSETVQVACAGCGTLHRVTRKRDDCRVTALAGPVRSARTVIERDISGEECEIEQWFTEDDWRPVGALPGGFEALGQIACRHCGRVGQMLSHQAFLYPGGYVRGASRREECPVCRGPMECCRVTDAI